MAFVDVFRTRSGQVLSIALVFALVHGLIYVFIVPPWQHYDEPNHFEYFWFIASRGVLPAPGDYDQDMRRAVAASMIENGFFKDLGPAPNVNSEAEPIWIGGYSQLTNPPLYYILAALPLIVVGVNKLGVINHLLLTLEHASCMGLSTLGYVLNNMSSESSLAAETNREGLLGLTGVPCLGESSHHGVHKFLPYEVFEKEFDIRLVERLLSM